MEENAELVQAATAARQKMASEFDSFFKGMNHPMQELQNLGEKAASQAAAAMVQKLQQRGGHGIPASATTGAGFGGMFGKLFGLDGTAHGQVKSPEFAAPTSTHAAGKMFTVSTAEIHVGSANIAFGGAGAGSAASPGSSTAASYLGGFGLPSRGGVATGVATDVQQGIGFSQSSARVFGGGMTGGAGSGGATPSPGTGTASVMGDLEKGTALGQSALKTFGGNTNGGVQPFSAINGPNDPLGLNKSSTSSTSGAPGSMMAAGGGIMANAGGAVTGGLGLFSAYEGNGGVDGALSGAMSGMQLGMAVGGPVGAAIGAAGGALLGAVGPGGAEKARVYDLKQVRPRITADQDS